MAVNSIKLGATSCSCLLIGVHEVIPDVTIVILTSPELKHRFTQLKLLWFLELKIDVMLLISFVISFFLNLFLGQEKEGGGFTYSCRFDTLYTKFGHNHSQSKVTLRDILSVLF
jgi:hypothetical protein